MQITARTFGMWYVANSDFNSRDRFLTSFRLRGESRLRSRTRVIYVDRYVKTAADRSRKKIRSKPIDGLPYKTEPWFSAARSKD